MSKSILPYDYILIWLQAAAIFGHKSILFCNDGMFDTNNSDSTMQMNEQLTGDENKRSRFSSTVPASVTFVALSDVKARDMTFSRNMLSASHWTAADCRWRPESAAMKLHMVLSVQHKLNQLLHSVFNYCLLLLSLSFFFDLVVLLTHSDLVLSAEQLAPHYL